MQGMASRSSNYSFFNKQHNTTQPGTEADVEEYLRRKFSRYLQSLRIIEKEDLKLVRFEQLIVCCVYFHL